MPSKHYRGSTQAFSDDDSDDPSTPKLSVSLDTPQHQPETHSGGLAEDPLPLADVPDPQTEIGPMKEREKKKAKKKQGESETMKKFSPHLNSIQNALLSREFHPNIGKPCSCGSNSANFLCRDCLQSSLQCHDCLVKSHLQLPFHGIRQWNGLYFESSSLGSVGFVLNLGHSGHPCPNTIGEGRPFTIVHTNGVHELRVRFCHCDSPLIDEVTSLIKAGLFPASVEKPQTAFTLTLLKEYQVHFLTSKKSAYDYYRALQRLQNAAFPQTVPLRYKQLMRTYRIYDHLTTQRRAGQTHGIDAFFEHRLPGSTRVRCPSCPQLGVNVTLEEIEQTDEMLKHIYMIFLSVDANFRLQRKYKKDDREDVSLNSGSAYIANDEIYRQYVRVARPEVERCTCSDLRAVRLQNIIKFKNAVISGVSAVQCARHGFYISAVDLFKGEAFALTDYAVALALLELISYPWIFLCYDVWCQYHVNLVKRLSEHFETLRDVVRRILGAIPKGHIRGHVPLCQLLHSLDYLLNVGKTAAENIESGWGEQDTSAGSTKEMNAGHRHDTLDSIFAFWNFEKLIKMASSLKKQYISAAKELKRQEHHHNLLSQGFEDSNVQKWIRMYDEMTKVGPYKENGKVISVFDMTLPPGVKGPPTEAGAYEELAEKERAQEFASQMQVGLAQCLQSGIEIEEEQQRVQSLANRKKRNPDSRRLENARKRLSRDISHWRQSYYALFPLVVVDRKVERLHQDNLSGTNMLEVSNPEDDSLELPSRYVSAKWDHLGLVDAASAELLLRKGRACDQLDRIRLSVTTYKFNVKFKKDFVYGTSPNTKANRYLKKLLDDQRVAMDRYNAQWGKMVALGLPQKDQMFRHLERKDLNIKDVTKAPGPGDSKDIDSWIWTVGCPEGLSRKERDDWSVEASRVQWSRSRADRDRAREEVEILDAELQRNEKTCMEMERIWTEIGLGHTEGAAAYAHKQAAMHRKLKELAAKAIGDAQEQVKWIKEHFDPENEPESERPKHHRQPRHKKYARDESTIQVPEGELSDESDDDSSDEDDDIEELEDFSGL